MGLSMGVQEQKEKEPTRLAARPIKFGFLNTMKPRFCAEILRVESIPTSSEVSQPTDKHRDHQGKVKYGNGRWTRKLARVAAVAAW